MKTKSIKLAVEVPEALADLVEKASTGYDWMLRNELADAVMSWLANRTKSTNEELEKIRREAAIAEEKAKIREEAKARA